MATYTEDLKMEIPDKTPVELPIGYRAPETLEQLIARLVRNQQTQNYIAAQGAETFEEADDFDVDDDQEMTSPYEMNQMQEEYIHERAKSDTKSVAPVREQSMDDEAGEGERTEEEQPKLFDQMANKSEDAPAKSKRKSVAK